MTTIAMNDFAYRHTADSEYSHFDGEWSELVALVSTHWATAEEVKPGVCTVKVPTKGFFSSVVKVTKDTRLGAYFPKRREGEEPFIHVVADNGDKIPAHNVQIIVYSKEALGNDSTSDADYQIVSINASPYTEDIPQHYVSMTRNQLGLPGGTKLEYSNAEFARYIMFWSEHSLKRSS